MTRPYRFVAWMPSVGIKLCGECKTEAEANHALHILVESGLCSGGCVEERIEGFGWCLTDEEVPA